MRLMLASVLGVGVGLALAVVLTRLAVETVRAAGPTANPHPPLVTVAPWVQLTVWGIGAIAVLALASQLATRVLTVGGRARRTTPGPVSEPGGTLSESVMR
jgi:hypothetical protein